MECTVVPRTIVTLTLSADHRVADGRKATHFVAVFETLMGSPGTQ
ncbi:2-oxo acid dehydrogenase subunit E2 [Meridianimarinicoccus sp. RP-17]